MKLCSSYTFKGIMPCIHEKKPCTSYTFKGIKPCIRETKPYNQHISKGIKSGIYGVSIMPAMKPNNPRTELKHNSFQWVFIVCTTADCLSPVTELQWLGQH